MDGKFNCEGSSSIFTQACSHRCLYVFRTCAGFVCVRGFDRISRAPRPLYARLHFPASKITRNKNAAATDDE